MIIFFYFNKTKFFHLLLCAIHQKQSDSMTVHVLKTIIFLNLLYIALDLSIFSKKKKKNTVTSVRIREKVYILLQSLPEVITSI